MKKVSHASFDERLAVLGLLISKVNERIRFAVEKRRGNGAAAGNADPL